MCVSVNLFGSVPVFCPVVFYRVVPELRQGGKTRAGVPVRVQLLGNDPHYLAANAAKAVRLGAPAIDLNFGCGTIVNRHCGGAICWKIPKHSIKLFVPCEQPFQQKRL